MNARKFYLNEFSNEDKSQDKGHSPTQWIRNNLRLGSGKASKPVFLVEPLVMLGDLDKDIAGRIRFSRKGEKSGFLRDYSKMKIMDLSEVHAGGAGNAPILDTNWHAIKPMYEKKYRELINDKDKFVSINDIRLSRDCVKKAIKYLREIYRHRIGKTKVISLNNHTGKTA